MKVLEPGEKVTLPDGQTVKAVEVDICSMDEPCSGCAFEFELCSDLDDYIGSCGSGRPDGKFIIFVPSKKQEV